MVKNLLDLKGIGEKGLIKFMKYIYELNNLGFNCSIYYYIYVIALIFFQKKICDAVIVLLKNLIGFTPRL